MGFAGSIKAGGAKTIAVDENAELRGADARSEAPAGNLGAVVFVFCAWVRRTGAKARAADHASETMHKIEILINEFYGI